MGQKLEPQNPTINFQHGTTQDLSRVAVIASMPVQQMLFTPKEAVLFALNMLEGARECDPTSVASVTWPALERKRANG